MYTDPSNGYIRTKVIDKLTLVESTLTLVMGILTLLIGKVTLVMNIYLPPVICILTLVKSIRSW